MNKNLTLRDDLLRKSLESFAKSFNIKANQVGIGSEDETLEIVFTFGGKTHRKIFEVEANRPSRSVIGQILLRQEQTGKKNLLIADYVPSHLAELLREQGVSFLDANGNAFFNEPEFYIFISTKQRDVSIAIPKPNILFQSSGLRLLFVLLSIPNAENKTYRELAELAGISLGSVNEIISNLIREFYLVEKERNRLLLRKDELMKRWAQGYSETLRPKLRSVRFQTNSLDWWKDFDIAEAKAFWGGEIAADLLTNYLVPFKFTLYTRNILFSLKYLRQKGLERDSEGNVEVIEKFWNFNQEYIITPPLLVYADLVATADARNLETAQMIYDQQLARLVE